MCKSELFEYLLDVVSQETEINRERILSKEKSAEVVDARYILVYLLGRCGIYNSEIAHLTGLTRQAVGQMRTHFELRYRQGGKIFEFNFKRICKVIETN